MSDRQPATPDPDQFRRVVHFRRPRCPRCGSVRLKAYATRRRRDGLTRYSRCLACGARLLILVD